MSSKPTNKVMRVSDDLEWADDETRMRIEEMHSLWDKIESRRRWDIMAALLMMVVLLTTILTLFWLLLSL